MSALAKAAVLERCSRFQWGVLDWNASAIAFYESMGARLLADLRIVRLDGAALEAIANTP